MALNIGDILFQLIIFCLVLTGVISFTLFIRRILINTKVQSQASYDLNQKLDRIIELLEEKEPTK